MNQGLVTSGSRRRILPHLLSLAPGPLSGGLDKLEALQVVVSLCVTQPVVIWLEGGCEGQGSRKPFLAVFAQTVEREILALEAAGSLWRTGYSKGQKWS